MSLNSFRPRKYEDHEIVDTDNRVVGHVRVNPSSVLWARSGAKKWMGVSLREFAAFMEENGKPQAK